MATQYSFQKDPPVNVPVLINQINSSAAISVDVVDAHYQGSTTTLTVNMVSTLTQPQLDALTALVAAHDGTLKPFVVTFPQLFDDFVSANSSSALGWTSTTQNGGLFGMGNQAGPNHPGVVQISTGTLSTGIASYHLGLSDINLGVNEVDMEFMCHINTLGGGLNNYTFRIGLGDAAVGAFSNGAWLEYNSSNSPNWSICTANGGATTNTVTAFAADTGWHKFSLVCASDGSGVQFFVDDGSVGTVVTNFPTNPVGPVIQMSKLLGLAPSVVLIDYFYMKLPTNRT